MAESAERPCIYVLAGVNGAGKSSILGATFESRGVEYFNPDREARRLRDVRPALSLQDANAAAWNAGRALLEQAIARRHTFAFETTLGGKTITALLERAASEGLDVRVLYVGLSNPELHIARVRARIARGGHPIEERDIRRRYDTSRKNLIRLLPGLKSLRAYDNSFDADPVSATPILRLVLRYEQGRIVGPTDLAATPEWAKAIVAAVISLALGRGPRR